jgi:3-deoxy-D-manno-octulosonate 8-phosphate phosphatase (KDO 8-P phosphatase)
MTVLEKMAIIKAFAFDIDGVMTDGSLQLTEDGKYLRTFHIRDGYAIRQVVDHGYPVVVISGGKSEGAEKRLRDLGVQDIYQGVNTKWPVLENWVQSRGLDLSSVSYMGDDILDIPCLTRVGLAACPADAVPEVTRQAAFISKLNGGKGCVRDLIEAVLKIQQKWLT